MMLRFRVIFLSRVLTYKQITLLGLMLPNSSILAPAQ